MKSESDWYDGIEELMREVPTSAWEQVVAEVMNNDPWSYSRSKAEMKEILRGLIQKLSGFPPPWLLIGGPDGEIDTPDDIWIEPAYNAIEIQKAWDLHDGRNLGTMVVAVYRWDPDSMSWRRDTNYGMLGNPSKTRKADPDDPDDSLCS
jgi:hypothetical protein